MRTTASYLLRYFNAAGGMIRMHLKRCANDGEAFALLASIRHSYARVEIRRDDRLIWSGPPPRLAHAA